MSRTFRIGKRSVGEGQPCFIVAEISANHNHSFDRAVEIVRAAAQSGADAVKLQTYTPDTLTIDAKTKWFRIPEANNLWGGRTLYDLYSEAYTPWEWHPRLQEVAADLGLELFSTPFDDSAVDFLETLKVPAHKIASFELVDLRLLAKVARTGKPVIASTGMATLSEIEEAVATLRSNGTKDLALLKCTSAYPASPSEINLRTIPHLAASFDVIAGLSDHTMGGSVSTAAVALGAHVIEKHFTIRRADGGADSAFSMEPDEFAAMVRDIRQVEQALGGISYQRTSGEEKSLVFRRSLFVVEDMKTGDEFTPSNVRAIRPGYGLHTRHYDDVIGKRAASDIARGTPVTWELIGGKTTG